MAKYPSFTVEFLQRKSETKVLNKFKWKRKRNHATHPYIFFILYVKMMWNLWPLVQKKSFQKQCKQKYET